MKKLFREKNKPKVVAIISGKDSDMYLSKYDYEDKIFNMVFVKKEYDRIKKLHTLDVLILDREKIKMLFEWAISLDKDACGNMFFDPSKSLTIACNCFNEVLVTYYDKADNIILFEIFDNWWSKHKYKKKLSSEFAINLDDAKVIFKNVLDRI